MSSSASPIRGDFLEQEDGEQRHRTSDPPSVESKEAEAQCVNQQSTYDEHQWVTGIPLFIIMGAICLVCFLMLLDTSIIATVSIYRPKQGGFLHLTRLLRRPFPRLRPTFTHFRMSAGTVVLTSWQGKNVLLHALVEPLANKNHQCRSCTADRQVVRQF